MQSFAGGEAYGMFAGKLPGYTFLSKTKGIWDTGLEFMTYIMSLKQHLNFRGVWRKLL